MIRTMVLLRDFGGVPEKRLGRIVLALESKVKFEMGLLYGAWKRQNTKNSMFILLHFFLNARQM